MKKPLRRMVLKIREYVSVLSDSALTTYRTFTRRWYSTWQPPLNSWQRSDYGFYRRLYWGKAKGLELSGLFAKVLVNKIASWVMGRPPGWRCEDEPSQKALEEWWNNVHADVLQGYRSSKTQGDAFLVINSDLTVTLLAPDCVDPIVAADDYSHIIGWRVTLTLANPDTGERMTTIDEYYEDRRLHRIEVDGIMREAQTYPNLIGLIPIVLIANNADVGQVFGHAEAEALLSTMHRYGEVLDAAIEGNILQGRPTPVITFGSIQDENKFWQLYGQKQSQQLPDGSSQSVETLNVDLSQILTITNGSFDFKSPGSFSADVSAILQILYYLILEYSEIPEFVMGNAVASSKASADTQMPVFERFIEGQQSDAEDWLTKISEIALAYLSLTEPDVIAQTPTLQWRKLTQDGRLMLDTVTWAWASGLLDKRSALMLAPLEVENVDAILAAVEEQEVAAGLIAPAASILASEAADRRLQAAGQSEQPEEAIAAEYADPEKAAIVSAAASILQEAAFNGHAITGAIP